MQRDHVISQALAENLPLELEEQLDLEHEYERARPVAQGLGRNPARGTAQRTANSSSARSRQRARSSGGGAHSVSRSSTAPNAPYSGAQAGFGTRATPGHARSNFAGPRAAARMDDPRSRRLDEGAEPALRRPDWAYRQPPDVPPPWLAALLRLIPATTTAATASVDPAPPADEPAAAPTDAAPPQEAVPAPSPAPANDAAPAAGELMPWLDHALRSELESAPALGQELRAALERWNLATNVSGAPTFSRLLERWRPVHAPEIPTTLLVAFSKYEASGWGDATHGTRANGYTSPPFYELGVFQVPAGAHGPCTDKGCGLQPPGAENPAQPSAWARLCKRLGLDPKNWDDPTTQVRVGLCNLEDDAKIIRQRYPELFAQPGSDWDLRAAVLLPFVGIGFANALLKKYRARLAALHESDRWSFLSQQAIAADPNKAPRVRELLANVEKKMRLHGALKAHFAGNPVATVTPVQPAPATVPTLTADAKNAPPLVGEDVRAFASRLGALWSKRRGGKPSAEALRDWLLEGHRATLTGASARFKNRYPESAITRAWMISVEQQMQFQLDSGSLKSLRGFSPPSAPVVRTASPLVGGSDKEKVAPVVVRFVRELQQRFPTFSADTYRGHGGGAFAGQGYSLDLYLKSGRDERGFFKPKAAVEFLRAVGAAAQAAGLEWRVLYNDFSVANVINRETGVQRVFFIGSANASGLNWHGPHPLILHFHLDLGVTH
jgi:hypothetical protein